MRGTTVQFWRRRAFPSFALFFALVTASAGCQTAYYSFWEKLGREKRDLLESNVRSAESQQREIQKQFKDTLSRVRAEFKVNGGDLESAYDSLSDDYESASKKADSLRGRIKNVKTIADDLFAEWAAEAKTIQTASLRDDSREKLRASRQRFDRMYASMHKVEKAMDPVLARLKDQVLYLKHNLNAKAVDALQGELKDVEREISDLNQVINHSIQASETFTQTFRAL